MNIDKIRDSSIYRFLIGIKHYIEYLYSSVKFKSISIDKYKILNDDETVNLIINNHKSIARYGDGEFKWIIGMKQKNIKKDDSILRKKLISVLTENNDNLLVGIPSFLNDMSKFTIKSKKYWKLFLYKSYNKIKKYLRKDKIYCDSYITRPYMDLKDKNKKDVEKRFDNLKKIWNKKDIIIVEGEYSRLGVNNDLFDNSKSIKRIICPSENAFEKYNQILNSIKQMPKDNLIMLSLGPTATVLASDLSKIGYQAIDIGHIDIEYMWFKMGAKRKIKIDGKYVNEVDNNNPAVELYDDNYKNQIIKIIK